ncbi:MULTISPECIES: SDR family oxidoreductase [Planktothricoides]|uniref:SDR family oxidoreductase n=2 Tax=Planktothricoides raciborskii TaxID=132608 RepID=A0AAU8JGH0_9CYAN|nr:MULTISPECIES: SDR family oxidoreductase [Planktothricoides]KOR35930.1 epimerase [Planktothricoides sp. SR001]MBD2544163.1 SDR family oxidoreductase [Planktothricoides raciborskii FACHB-1370]MBD2583941.1 SDR family oxidoreductase [Planktothricoides raciborskii FACHB-1261]
MNILIIGCGYVGTAVAKLWKEGGHTLTVTTTTPERVPELQAVAHRVEILRGDDLERMRDVLKDQEVVLLSVGAKNRTGYEQTYLKTAETLVTALKEVPTVQQLIYTGSYAVYGDRQGALVDEESPVCPANENGEILYKTEQVLLAAASEQLTVSILRIAGIYGPGRTLLRIFQNIAGKTRPGTGQEIANWIHLDDIVGSLDFILCQQLGGIYNLGNDSPMTTGELLDGLFECHGLPKVIWDPSTPQVRPYNARLSNEKLKAAGYNLIHPKIEF